MATMVKLMAEKGAMVKEVFDRQNVAHEERQKETEAITRVQSWYRGQKVRAYLRFLHDSAVIIQSTWRGHLGRKAYRLKLKNDVFIMRLNFYNAQAVKIQKVWKGYYTRKYIFNYYSRKKYLEGLMTKNDLVRRELNDYKDQQDHLRRLAEEEMARKQLEEHASKHHYLLSTKVVPGIYDSPYKPYPDDMEFILRSTRPRSHKKEKVTEEPFDPTCKKYGVSKSALLPPIPQKPQGPFKDPEEVQKQRYKSFQPSLRVETAFYSVDEARDAMKRSEWVGRVNDNLFVPFTKRHRQYDPLLHTTSSYGHLPYGTKYFREEHIDKHVTQQLVDSKQPQPLQSLCQSLPQEVTEVHLCTGDREANVSDITSDLSTWSDTTLPPLSPCVTPCPSNSNIISEHLFHRYLSSKSLTTPIHKVKYDSTDSCTSLTQSGFIRNKAFSTISDTQVKKFRLPSSQVFGEIPSPMSSEEIEIEDDVSKRSYDVAEEATAINLLKEAISQCSTSNSKQLLVNQLQSSVQSKTSQVKKVDFRDTSASEEDFIAKCKSLLRLKNSADILPVISEENRAKPLLFKRESDTSRARAEHNKQWAYKTLAQKPSASILKMHGDRDHEAGHNRPKYTPSDVLVQKSTPPPPPARPRLHTLPVLPQIPKDEMRQSIGKGQRRRLSDAFTFFCDRSENTCLQIKSSAEKAN